jgi:hypothetical protein
MAELIREGVRVQKAFMAAVPIKGPLLQKKIINRLKQINEQLTLPCTFIRENIS